MHSQLCHTLLTTLRPSWEALGFDFYNGHCHNLACALIETFKTGRLLAGCSFVYINEDDYERLPTSYYHMIYQDENDHTWDIDGNNAIGRWEEAHGVEEFMWVPVQLDTLESWLIEHNATFNREVVEALKLNIRSIIERPEVLPSLVSFSIDVI